MAAAAAEAVQAPRARVVAATAVVVVASDRATERVPEVAAGEAAAEREAAVAATVEVVAAARGRGRS